MPQNYISVVRKEFATHGQGTARPQAIDLYSGIGGWSLGLRMAGIETVASYEWWGEAARTYEVNFGRRAHIGDIRSLPLQEFPSDVDFVVGSPPCTQFSFANRGGNGNIAEGLKDIYKFLEVVERVQPQYWVMENVPRVAKILERELNPAGELRRFRNLVPRITVVDMTDFGLPQRRRRMLAGNFPLDLLLSYRGRDRAPTLGQVIRSLASDPVTDPIYGVELSQDQLRDHLKEQSLTDEEARLNREAKQRHPFYNVMNFPDPLGRTSRTVTALCTRVSRESIIISITPDDLRRLTLRERATLQGLPITFQLAGRTFSDRLKMIGNAIPPLLVYFIAKSFLGTSVTDLKTPRELEKKPRLPAVIPPEATPRAPRNSFPPNRRFRAVIPGLRFGSGVRFELTNSFADGAVRWRTSFYYGTSKNILSIGLAEDLLKRCTAILSSEGARAAESVLTRLQRALAAADPNTVQDAWTHRKEGIHPFTVIDILRRTADELLEALSPTDRAGIETFVLSETDRAVDIVGQSRTNAKLRRTASAIFAGFVVGSWFNAHCGLATTVEDLTEAV